MVNDDRYFTAMADSRGTWDDNQGSSTIILQVNESDSIYTVHYDGTDLFADGRHHVSTFTGALLYADI